MRVPSFFCGLSTDAIGASDERTLERRIHLYFRSPILCIAQSGMNKGVTNR
jgi:hypothetical protein